MSPHVRFGSLADMAALSRDVRFTHNSGQTRRRSVCPPSANSGHSGYAVSMLQWKPDVRSFTREILSGGYDVRSHGFGVARQGNELFIVAPGPRVISGPLGGLRCARKGAIAVRIVAQRRLEFLQCLPRLIGFEQQFAEHFPYRRKAISIATCLPLRSSRSAAFRIAAMASALRPSARA